VLQDNLGSAQCASAACGMLRQMAGKDEVKAEIVGSQGLQLLERVLGVQIESSACMEQVAPNIILSTHVSKSLIHASRHPPPSPLMAAPLASASNCGSLLCPPPPPALLSHDSLPISQRAA